MYSRVYWNLWLKINKIAFHSVNKSIFTLFSSYSIQTYNESCFYRWYFVLTRFTSPSLRSQPSISSLIQQILQLLSVGRSITIFNIFCFTIYSLTCFICSLSYMPTWKDFLNIPQKRVHMFSSLCSHRQRIASCNVIFYLTLGKIDNRRLRWINGSFPFRRLVTYTPTWGNYFVSHLDA